MIGTALDHSIPTKINTVDNAARAARLKHCTLLHLSLPYLFGPGCKDATSITTRRLYLEPAPECMNVDESGHEEETEVSTANKLKRGTFPATWFLACLAALDFDGVVLEEI